MCGCEGVGTPIPRIFERTLIISGSEFSEKRSSRAEGWTKSTISIFDFLAGRGGFTSASRKMALISGLICFSSSFFLYYSQA